MGSNMIINVEAKIERKGNQSHMTVRKGNASDTKVGVTVVESMPVG